MDAEIKKLVETARENCHKLLQENINLLHALAKALLDRETITGDDIDLLVKGEPLPPFDTDGSAAKRNLRLPPLLPLTRRVKPSSWKRNRLRMAGRARKRRTKPNSSKRLAPASCGCRGIQLY